MAPVTGAAGQETMIIKAVVDSGAEDTVTAPGVFTGEVVPSPMSREGKNYRAANSTRIPNLGQLMVHFEDAAGRACGMPFQVADVERPLVSVSRLTQAGHRVSFEGSTGTITHEASGRVLPLRREGGVYVLELRVPRKGDGDKSATFHRQGQ